MTGRSGRGTARQTIRVGEDLWEKLDAAAKALGTDRSTWIRDAIRWCVHEDGAEQPIRPDSLPGPADQLEQQVRDDRLDP